MSRQKALGGTWRLNDGSLMPGFGFGCYKAAGQEVEEAVLTALDLGYRYIDTAAYYGNEDRVGAAIRRSNVPREEIFVLSKLWPTDFGQAVRALEQSLSLLGLDYLDGYLLHWPGLDESVRLRVYEQLLAQREGGKIRVLGASNFLEEHLTGLKACFGMWPALNQIEIHPSFAQSALCAFCAAQGIQVISWSPLGRGRDLATATVLSVAAVVNKTPAQVVLRWHLQKGLLAIPKSVHPERIEENCAVFDFSLSPEQISALDALELPEGQGRMGPDPRSYPPAV